MDNITLINDYIEDQTFVNTIFDQTYINTLLYKDNATNMIQNISFNNNTIVIKPKQNNIKKQTFAQFVISYLQSQYPMKIISYDSTNNKIIISTPTTSALNTNTPSAQTTNVDHFAPDSDLTIVTDDPAIADNIKSTVQLDKISIPAPTPTSDTTTSNITTGNIITSNIISDKQTANVKITKILQYILLFIILLLFVFILRNIS